MRTIHSNDARRRAARASVARRLCAVAIFAGLVFATISSWQLERSYQSLDRAQRSLATVKTQLAQREAAQKRADAAAILKSEAASVNLVSTDWDERKFNVRQAIMDRAEANKLMQEVQRTPENVFASDQFDISVGDIALGIFSPAPSSAELTVTLRGTALFTKAGERP